MCNIHFTANEGCFLTFLQLTTKGQEGIPSSNLTLWEKKINGGRETAYFSTTLDTFWLKILLTSPPSPQEYFFIQITGFLFKLLLYFVLKSQQKTKLSVRLSVCVCVCTPVSALTHVCVCVCVCVRVCVCLCVCVTVCIDCQVFVCLKLKLATMILLTDIISASVRTVTLTLSPTPVPRVKTWLPPFAQQPCCL